MMITCHRCRTPYMQSKSTSALALTYCGVLCETADLGFSLAAFETVALSSSRRNALPRTEGAVARRDTNRELAA